jgi:hypothetical protein
MSCEKQEYIPESPGCKECITTIIYPGGERETVTIFSCDPEEIKKREALNLTRVECEIPVVYKTICYKPDCKNK